MSYATLAYIPPARLHAESFLRNLNHYKREYPIIFYSDCNTPGMFNDCKFHEIPDPTSIKLSRNKIAIHNRIYLHALEIAQKRGIKRFIYLENDVRVGCDYWDKKIFDEAEQYRDMFVAGSPAIYNSKAFNAKQRFHVSLYVNDYIEKSGWRVPVFESKHPRPLGCAFIMGAGACYSTDVMADLFMGFERDAHQKAIKTPAFDLWVGMRCVQLFGVNAARKLPFLTCMFSSYGNKINTEKERVEMLMGGKACLVHQIKGNLDCI